MDHTAILKTLRLIAAEFEGVPDETVKSWIYLCVPLVSRKKFGDLYHQAIALLAAHRMKLANVNAESGADPLADIGNIGAGNLSRVASFSEGQVSVSFNSNTAQHTEPDAELALTVYGVQFLSLRRMRVMPIVSAGQSYGRA